MSPRAQVRQLCRAGYVIALVIILLLSIRALAADIVISVGEQSPPGPIFVGESVSWKLNICVEPPQYTQKEIEYVFASLVLVEKSIAPKVAGENVTVTLPAPVNDGKKVTFKGVTVTTTPFQEPGEKTIRLKFKAIYKAKGQPDQFAESTVVILQVDVSTITVKINGTSRDKQKFDDDIVVRKAGKDDPPNDGKSPIAGRKVLDVIPSIPMEITNNANKAVSLFLEQTSTSGAAVSFWRDLTLKQQIGKADTVSIDGGKSTTIWIVGEKESPVDMRDVKIRIHDGKADGPVVDEEAVTVLWVKALEPRATGELSPGYDHQDIFDTVFGLKNYKQLGVFNSKGGLQDSGGLFGAIQLEGQVFPTNLKGLPFSIKDYKTTDTGKNKEDSVTTTPIGFVWQRLRDGIKYVNGIPTLSKGFDDSDYEVQAPIPRLAGKDKNLMIYDFDAPGFVLNPRVTKAGDKLGYRYNFVQWVTFTLNGKTFRASNKVNWHAALTGTVNANVTLIERDDKTYGKQGNEVGPGHLKKLTEDFK